MYNTTNIPAINIDIYTILLCTVSDINEQTNQSTYNRGE